ncbi:isocitrate lyase/PEP mutase family protein [Dongshaea marina]|uniref:isocitrate lyase/PEP mutase family protein n=1 Tax=Dongshaea marina TaxID=2047966 RepID=UPI0019000EE2|nr:isocitrate lyase/PEP mutase family protein [Dongshaea marina]
MTSITKQLSSDETVLAAGCFNALSALAIEQAGFSMTYLSGANIAYHQLGRPDVGLVSMTEVAATLERVCERVEIPVIVDADTGFGNEVNTHRTVRLFEKMGAAAIQLEDQVTPKRCGHLKGKSLISSEEMLIKLDAALQARRSEDTLIIARTDAIAVEGFDAALARAHAYVEAGPICCLLRRLAIWSNSGRLVVPFQVRLA